MTTDPIDQRPAGTPVDLRAIELSLDAEGMRIRAGAPPGLDERVFSRTHGIVVAEARANRRGRLSIRLPGSDRFIAWRRLALAAGFALAVGIGVLVLNVASRKPATSSIALSQQLDRDIEAFLASTESLVASGVPLPADADDLDRELAALEVQADRFWATDDGDLLNGGSL